MDSFTNEELMAELRRNALLARLADDSGEVEASAYLDSLNRALEAEALSRGLISA